MSITRFFIIVLFLSPFFSKAQERKDSERPIIAAKILWTLTQSTGWIQNVEGKWIEGKNKIQKSDATISSKIIWDTYDTWSVGTDNFSKLELREVLINGKSYLILLKYLKDGFFKYKSIAKGWNNVNTVKYAVFEKIENQQNIDSVSKVFNTKAIYSGYTSSIGNEIFRSIETDILKQITSTDEIDKSEVYNLVISTSNYKNVTRFYIQLVSNYDSDKFLPIYGGDFSKTPLKDYYYETALGNLNGLIKYLNVK